MQKIIIASGPVIVEDGKVLLDIQGEDEFWKFCGGKTREGENLSDTAARRAREELGIEIEISDRKPFLMYVKKETPEGIVDILLVHFLAERKGEILQGSAVKKWGWLDVRKLPDNVGPNIKPALEYFKYL